MFIQRCRSFLNVRRASSFSLVVFTEGIGRPFGPISGKSARILVSRSFFCQANCSRYRNSASSDRSDSCWLSCRSWAARWIAAACASCYWCGVSCSRRPIRICGVCCLFGVDVGICLLEMYLVIACEISFTLGVLTLRRRKHPQACVRLLRVKNLRNVRCMLSIKQIKIAHHTLPRN